MKKALFLILALCGSAQAVININEGSQKAVRTATAGGQEIQGVTLLSADGLSTATVRTDGAQLVAAQQIGTYAVTPATGTWPVSGTFFQTTQPISGSVGQVGTFAVTSSSGVFQTISTNTVITQAVFLASGTVTNPLVITGMVNATSTSTINVAVVSGGTALAATTYGTAFPASGYGMGFNSINGGLQGGRVDISSNIYVNPASVVSTVSTYTYVVNLTTITHGGIAQPIVIVSSGSNVNPFYVSVLSSGSSVNPWNVVVPVAIQLASGTATSPINVVVPVAVQLSSGGPNSPFNVGLVNIATVTYNGVPQPIWSTMTVPSGMLVSSTSFLAPLTQGTTAAPAITSWGGLEVSDIPPELQTSTYNAVLGGDTAEHVLISSAPAGQRIYMCGCIFKNTSATNTGYTLFVSTSNNTGRNFTETGGNPIGIGYPFGAPANYFPSGVRADCGHPFMWSILGGQITYKADATQTAVMNCSYITR